LPSTDFHSSLLKTGLRPPLHYFFAQTFFETVAPVDHAVKSFSLKPFLKRLAFLIKLFLKKFAIKHFFEKACVFDQTFFEKVCGNSGSPIF